MASPKVCLLGRTFPNHDQEPYQRSYQPRAGGTPGWAGGAGMQLSGVGVGVVCHLSRSPVSLPLPFPSRPLSCPPLPPHLLPYPPPLCPSFPFYPFPSPSPFPFPLPLSLLPSPSLLLSLQGNTEEPSGIKGTHCWET